MGMGSKVLAVLVGIGVVACIALAGNIFQDVNANEIVVIQDPIDGERHVYVEPGVQWQNFGTVTIYPKRAEYPFTEEIRFNDGAKATMEGSIQYEYPLDPQLILDIHAKFNNPTAVQDQLVAKVVNKAAYYTGPLMTSKESYAEKRNDLIWYISDQIKHGVYRTRQRDVRAKDELTGQDKTVTVVDIVKDEHGKPERQEAGILTEIGIEPFNPALKVHYSDNVEQQIAAQQQALMDVQLAVAESKKAEQRAQTVEQQGRATAAEAKWRQEAEKAQRVTLAEQQKEVAVLDANREFEVRKTNAEAALTEATLQAQTALQYKAERIARADADSTYRRKMMESDNALEQKLEAWVQVNTAAWEALSKYGGALVPGVVFASNGSSGTASAADTVQSIMQMFAVNQAKQIGLDLDMGAGKRVAAAQ